MKKHKRETATPTDSQSTVNLFGLLPNGVGSPQCGQTMEE
jgi:hypothetical protein